MKTSIVAMLLSSVVSTVVHGHGYIVNPELTWRINPYYEKTAPASQFSAYNQPGGWERNPLDIYPNLRYMVERDSPNTNIDVIKAHADRKCGMTTPAGTVRTVGNSITLLIGARHKGPCEVWLDDTLVLSSRDMITDYPNNVLPIDMSKCGKPTCVLQWVWVATHIGNYEIYKNCITVTAGAPPPDTTTTSPPPPPPPPPSCPSAPSGGSCGAANGLYCPNAQCCSQWGFCGIGSPWCDNNPNSVYNGGRCSTQPPPTCRIVAPGGVCGATTRMSCPSGQCCSRWGFCGVGSPWCDSNPNSAYNGGRCPTLLLADDTNEEQDARAQQAPQVGGAAAKSDAAAATAVANVADAGDGVPPLSTILTKRTFDRIFPDAEGSILTYEGLIEAAQSYSEFAQTVNPDIDVLEMAYFLTHVAVTTQNLMYPGEPDGTMYNPDKYCQASKDHPCAPGASYYGRGPLYLRWNFRYKECGDAIGVDLYNSPSLALSTPTIAWKTALWAWFDLGLHEISTLPDAFATSTKRLVGDTECGNSPTAPAANAARVARFRTIARMLGVTGIAKLTLFCTDAALDLMAAGDVDGTDAERVNGGEGNQSVSAVVATARLMASEASGHTQTGARGLLDVGAASAVVVGVAMTALVVAAVVTKRKADAMKAKIEMESVEYLLMGDAH